MFILCLLFCRYNHNNIITTKAKNMIKWPHFSFLSYFMFFLLIHPRLGNAARSAHAPFTI